MAFLISYNTLLLRNLTRFLFFLYFIPLSFAQNVYQGEINFNYNGTVNGSFTSISGDSLITGLSINQVVNDTALVIMASITQQDENEFDLFLAVLRDTTYPIQPRSWSIPGEGDQNNPLSLESIIVFMPELDSSFVENIFDFFSDTSESQNPNELISSIFSSFSNNLYLGLEGDLEVSTATDTTLIGAFNTVMLKPAFYFPPHTISIANGTFNLENLEAPILKSYYSSTSTIPNISFLPPFPNPFNPRTKITFFINNSIEDALVKIYNSSGQQVNTLHCGLLSSGSHTFYWEPKKQLATGIYFFVIQEPYSIQSQKLLYLK